MMSRFTWPGAIAGTALALLAVAAWTRPAQAQDQARDTTPVIGIPEGAKPMTQAWKTIKAFRVCGDPDNLPFSNTQRQGFENKIAALLAKQMGDSVTYLWWPHRRGFVRSTLSAEECDVIMGVPTNFDPALETKPYYRSTYYIVSRADRHIGIKSLDDPALKNMKIGVNIIGYDYTNTPPAEALAARGISKNIKGYSTFYNGENKPSDIINAVVKGDVDVALVWGPLAGYYAKASPVPLTLVALPDTDSATKIPFAYSMAIGVRHADRELKDTLNGILERVHPEILAILHEYHVPTIPMEQVSSTKSP
jgi:quinoprotein dehydrogenase-associated probable ABC transporter substrate-binding protein